MKVNRGNYAVAEIFGTLLLISMAVSTFAAVSYVVIHPAFIAPEVEISFVNLEGAIQQWNVTFLHIGGYDLDMNVNVTITVAGTGDQFVDVPTFLEDINGDNKWNIGEMVIKNLGDISGRRVEGKVIERNKNRIIWQGVLQNGTIATRPYVITDHVEVGKGEARLHMTYNFLNNYSGYIQFLYGPDGSEWIETGWVPQSGSGTFSTNISGLINGTIYNYTALGNYTFQDKYHIIWGGNKSFNTDDWIRGDWHFDDDQTLLFAEDSSNYDNDGSIHGATYDTDAINGSALKFDGTGDYVEVPDADSLDLTEKISIKGWLKNFETDEAYPGKINEIEKIGFDPMLTDIVEPDIIHVSENVYALAFRSEDEDTNGAYVQTCSISDNGIIGVFPILKNKIEEVEYYLEPDIYFIGNDPLDPSYGIYAIAYGANPSAHAATSSLATVRIAWDGLDIELIDSANFRKYYGREPRIARVTNDIFAISFGGSDNSNDVTGYLITVKINNEGDIDEITENAVDVKDTFKFAQNYILETDVIQILGGQVGSIYAIAYCEGSTGSEPNMGNIITVIIDSGGIISLVDQFNFTSDSRYGTEPCFVHINGNYYAISYGGDLKQGVLRTIKIENDGTIGEEDTSAEPGPGGSLKSFKDRLLLDTPYIYETEIVHVDEDLFAIAYTGAIGLSGELEIPYLITVSIDDSGEIANSIINKTQFLNNRGYEPSIVRLSGQEMEESIFFAITYGGKDNDDSGFLVTVGINLSGNIRDVIDKNDAYEIKITGTTVTTIINAQGTYTPLNGPITSGWNFVVLTYDSTAFSNQMKLYINGSLVANDDLFGEINTNSNDLIFGKFKGILDEVAIYSRILEPGEIEEEYYTFGGVSEPLGGGDEVLT